MDEIDRLQYISICSKVSEELHAYLGIKDKLLTEYVIDKAIISKDEDDFIQKMNEDEAGFSFKLASSIFSDVHSMLPPKIIQKRRGDIERENEGIVEEKEEKGKGERFVATNKVEVKGESNGKEETPQNHSALARKFPGLAIPNADNEEEIELDLSEEEGEEEVKDVGEKAETETKVGDGEKSQGQGGLERVKRRKNSESDSDDAVEQKKKRKSRSRSR